MNNNKKKKKKRRRKEEEEEEDEEEQDEQEEQEQQQQQQQQQQEMSITQADWKSTARQLKTFGPLYLTTNIISPTSGDIWSCLALLV